MVTHGGGELVTGHSGQWRWWSSMVVAGGDRCGSRWWLVMAAIGSGDRWGGLWWW